MNKQNKLNRQAAYEQLSAMIDEYNKSREVLDQFAKENDLPLGFTSYEGYARTQPENEWRGSEQGTYDSEWYGSELCW